MRRRLRQLAEPVASFFARRVRTPVILQFDNRECGAACLAIVLAHFGRWVPLQTLREACAITRDGCSAADIARAARRQGLRITGWRKEIGELRSVPLPAILFWRFDHFVVLEAVGRRSCRLNDPGLGRRRVGVEEFDKSFTGVVLLVEKTAAFRPDRRAKPGLGLLRPWFAGARGPLAFAAAAGLLLVAPTLATPILLALLIDEVLTARVAPPWALMLPAAALAAAAAAHVLTWLQQRCLHRLTTRLSILQADRFVRHLFRLPVHFFMHRFAGDLMARVQTIGRVAAQSSVQVVSLLVDLAVGVVYLALMVYFDAVLAAVVAALAAASVVLTRFLSRARTEHNGEMRRHQAIVAGVSAAGLRDVDTLQATAGDDDFHARWAGHQAQEITARQRFGELGHVIAALPAFFSILGTAAVVGIGGWRALAGGMSPGALFGFSVLTGSFLRPVGRFVQFADMLQVLETDLQRLNDVFGAAEDPVFKADEGRPQTAVAHVGGRLRLAGRIEFRDVTFGYRQKSTPLVDRFSLAIDPGQRVAVVGATGSGKSTLVLLLSGVHAPWSGRILLDGVPLGDIPRDVLTASMAVVSQHPFLFAGTVRDNLTLWNDTLPPADVRRAAADALLHDVILSRPGGYDAPVEEGGRNFSGGQRQRFEIARALVRNPSILVLDEATCSLDPVTEADIDGAFRRRGCTCFIVAHRLSTIRDCDRIVVLDRGRVVQSGTHAALAAVEDGAYARLLRTG